MVFFKRLLQFAAVALILAAVQHFAAGGGIFAAGGDDGDDGFLFFDDNKKTLTLWYTDESLTDYLNREAARFGEQSDDVRVVPVLKSGLGFLEEVGRASAAGSDYPDLYLTTHDNLEKAALAGLAAEIEHSEDSLRGDYYPQAALSAVTWHGKKIAYPFCAETTAFLYNRTYLEDQIKSAAEEAEQPIPEGEELDELATALIPRTLPDLLEFAGHYNAPELVESVFLFDVSDLFTSYFFAGDALNVGGENGDDKEVFDIYNEEALTCLDIYQQLGQFFAIDPNSTDPEKVMRDFMDGKTVFTIATTEAARRIEEEKTTAECPYRFGASELFSLTDEIPTRALSVTTCIVINGFSEHQSEADRFARFLTDEGTEELYARTGKMTARSRASFSDDEDINAMLKAYTSVYAGSVPMPKMLETSNYWVRLEIAFTDIWKGESVNETLRQVSGSLLSQIRGEETEIEAIPDPERIEISGDIAEDDTEE